MPLITRAEVAPCELPEETVTAPAIGGDVLVRGLDMPQFLRFKALARELGVPRDGEDQAQTDERSGAQALTALLSMTVLADDGEPVYTAEQWSHFAVRHMAEVMDLCGVAMRLSGLEKDPGKS